MIARRLVGLIAVVAATMLLPAASVEAAFPGSNGKIVFESASNYEIYTMNPDGTQPWRLTYDSSSADGCASWSADGRLIAWERFHTIWAMNADGTNQHMLNSNGQCPAWSPDGSKIVFSRGGSGFEGIYVMNSDGTGVVQLDNHARAAEPSWSPDGQKIAFSAWDSSLTPRIFVMNSDGTEQSQVTFNIASEGLAADCCPDWAPNSETILFHGARGLETVKPDGTARTLVTDQLFGPSSWSPDGTKIAVSSWDGDDFEIYTIDADGTNQIQLTNNDWHDYTRSWQPRPGPIPAGHTRPRAATPTTIKLVPAQEPCTAANAVHGTPLDQPSCNPPRQSSEYLTVGTGDGGPYAANSTGTLIMKAIGESPLDLTNGDQSDVAIMISITAVRCIDLSGVCPGPGAGYPGPLRASFPLRLTDRYSGWGGVYPATSVDTSFTFNFSCSAPDPSIGSTCSAATSADAVTPGIALEARRAIWQMGQVEIYDSGNDGNADTTGDNTLFLTQGTFVP